MWERVRLPGITGSHRLIRQGLKGYVIFFAAVQMNPSEACSGAMGSDSGERHPPRASQSEAEAPAEPLKKQPARRDRLATPEMGHDRQRPRMEFASLGLRLTGHILRDRPGGGDDLLKPRLGADRRHVRVVGDLVEAEAAEQGGGQERQDAISILRMVPRGQRVDVGGHVIGFAGPVQRQRGGRVRRGHLAAGRDGPAARPGRCGP